jgi:hypothetical protein
MKIGRNMIVAIIITFCFTATLFMIVPIKSTASSTYNPWADINDDGKIGLEDLTLLAKSYGATGTPIQEANIRYDSGWINITDKCGQYFSITHNLNSTDIIVDITGRTTMEGGTHQRYLGLTNYMQGCSKTYGGAGNDWAYSMVQTKDGGYALAGSTDSFGAGAIDFWLEKTDSAGNMQWNKTYGGTRNDEAYSVVQTSDGGYALAGRTASFSVGASDFWLVKTDASGNMMWNKTYGGTGYDSVSSVVQTSDGYALAGQTGSFGAGFADFWLVKTDASGNMMWNKTYGGTADDLAPSMIQTADGGYALAGTTASFGSGYTDAWLVKTDASGNMMWNKTYGETGGDGAYSIVQTTDGGYALAGVTYSFGAGNADFWLVKTDGYGNTQWNQTYGGTDYEYANSVAQTADGGYVLAGTTTSLSANVTSFWLVKTDGYGNTQWNQTYGETGDNEASSMVQTKDGGYELGGYTDSSGAGGYDFWLVKTGLESGLAWTDLTANALTLYRGATDAYWNFVRVQIWQKRTP